MINEIGFRRHSILDSAIGLVRKYRPKLMTQITKRTMNIDRGDPTVDEIAKTSNKCIPKIVGKIIPIKQ